MADHHTQCLCKSGSIPGGGSKTSTEWPGERCDCCGKRVVAGFTVEDDVWGTVARDYRILCLSCFDLLAQKRSVRYTIIGVYPVTWCMWEDDLGR